MTRRIPSLICFETSQLKQKPWKYKISPFGTLSSYQESSFLSGYHHWSRRFFATNNGEGRSREGGVPSLIFSKLDRRAIVVKGPDAMSFLQNLMTNDVKQLQTTTSPGSKLTRAIYTGFLSSQGRFLYDGFISYHPEKQYLIVDVESSCTDKLLAHFRQYKLRSKVSFSFLEKEEGDVHPLLLLNSSSPSYPSVPSLPSSSLPLSFVDPRLPQLGLRVWASEDLLSLLSSSSHYQIDPSSSFYSAYRSALGVAEGSELAGMVALEANLDILNGVSFNKGCYIGQELTTRTHFTGVVRKRVVPFVTFSSSPSPAEWARHFGDSQHCLGLNENFTRSLLSSPTSTESLKTGAQLYLRSSSTDEKEKSVGTVLAQPSIQSQLGLAVLRLSSLPESSTSSFVSQGDFNVDKTGLTLKVYIPGWWHARMTR